MRPWRALPLPVLLGGCSVLNLFSAPAVDSTDCSPVLTLYRDRDGDGYGVTGDTRLGCGAIPGWARAPGDCNDTPGAGDAVHPQAVERCDRVDQDCSNGGRDEPDEDSDEDGHAPTEGRCTGGPLPRDDCDDTRDDVHRGLDERCDARDNNCDGMVDEEPGADLLCQGPNARAAVCRSGACIVTCEANQGDCNRDARDGCEIDLRRDARHCGGCGMRCGVGSVCEDGRCRGRIHQVAVGRAAQVDESGAARSHTCAVRTDLPLIHPSRLLCWGSNEWGQLGLPPAGLPESRAPIVSVSASMPLAVAAGATSTCTVEVDGSVLCWGAPGVSETIAEPRPVRGLFNAAQIAMTQTFNERDATCIVTTGGALLCWGDNLYGILGVGTTTVVARPTEVELPAPVLEIGMAPTHTCARTAEAIYCWGRNREGQLGDGTTIDRLRPVLTLRPPAGEVLSRLVVGERFSCASSSAPGASSPTLRCWGQNAHNLMGLSPRGTPSEVPAIVTTPEAVATRGSTAALLAAGHEAWCTGLSPTVTLAGETELRVDEVLCAGGLFYRQVEALVEYRDVQALSPVRALRKLRSLTFGPDHACGIQDDAQVICWGENAAGQCGDGSASRRRTPGPVAALNPRVRVIGSSLDFLTLGADGVVGSRRNVLRAPFVGRYVRDVAFDRVGGAAFVDASGNVFYTSFPGGSAAPPVALPHPTSMRRVATTDHATTPNATVVCALDGASDVRCHRVDRRAGEGVALGTPNTDIWFVGLTGALLGSRFCAWTARGESWCWDATDSPTPRRRPGALRDVVGASLERARDCFLRNNGGVACVDLDGSREVDFSAAISDAVQLVSGGSHTCALRRNGRVMCFGSNGFGQLGDGTNTDRVMPVEVRGLDDAEAVFAGTEYTCARRQTGAIVCWGRNSAGQIDDGTLIDRSVPTPTLQYP
ncbi:MAG: MopE-related protein [Polyangiales bacterium]